MASAPSSATATARARAPNSSPDVVQVKGAAVPTAPASENGWLGHVDGGPRRGRPPPEGASVAYALRRYAPAVKLPRLLRRRRLATRVPAPRAWRGGRRGRRDGGERAPAGGRLNTTMSLGLILTRAPPCPWSKTTHGPLPQG